MMQSKLQSQVVNPGFGDHEYEHMNEWNNLNKRFSYSTDTQPQVC